MKRIEIQFDDLPTCIHGQILSFLELHTAFGIMGHLNRKWANGVRSTAICSARTKIHFNYPDRSQLPFLLKIHPRLENLRLGSNDGNILSDDVIFMISTLSKSLKTLNIHNLSDRYFTDFSLQAIGRSYPQLNNLSLYSNGEIITNISDTAFKVLMKKCFNLNGFGTNILMTPNKLIESFRYPNLITLYLHHVNNIIVIDWIQALNMIINSSNIHHLQLSNCSHFNDEILLLLVKKCPLLTNLRLIESFNTITISDVGIIGMTKALPKLKQLVLNNCAPLTDISLFALSDHTPLLESLEITNDDENQHHSFSSGGLISLVTQCKILKSLILLNVIPPLNKTIRDRILSINPALILNVQI